MRSLTTPFLDHVFAVVDTPTYRAATGSGFLRDRYARVAIKQARSTLAGDYTSMGVVGLQTLVELFEAPPLPGIHSGLVLTFEQPGGLFEARERLGAAARYQLVERTVDGTTRQWYHLLRPDLGEDCPVTLMLAQVTPDYFAEVGARPEPDGRLCRSAYLAAVLGGPAPPDRLLRDVVGVTLRLRSDQAKRFAAALEAVGYRSLADAYLAPGVEIRLVADDDRPAGVVAARTALSAPWTGDPLRLGEDCVIDRDGWTFVPGGNGSTFVPGGDDPGEAR